ncbi:AMP-binding protein [Saccharopolyspora sp. NFXS83]|uniref:class I adenylate-forming enzyme family protein n=1 Tax=Saccharopolyspora sp. NFXS83 TaxID=2993560 RepID=UPI00224B5C22|nr:AMP-binding protein [Saccharopolyspora sp. NFXS83]MCX2729132.1 AMP-binding protein [Saccharopolyspora sp. NFXS83]
MRELVAELESRAATTAAGGDAVIAADVDGEHSLRELLHAAEELSTAVRDVAGPQATILVQADNSWRTVVAALAAGKLDGTLGLLSHHATRAEYDAACEDIDPAVVIASPECLGEWLPGSEGPQVLDGWGSRTRPTRPGPRWNGGVVIGLTSGSTGRPKGVVQSEAALRYAGRSTIDAVGLASGDSVAALVPLSSAAAFCFGLYLPLMLGGRIVFLDRWHPPTALRLMAEHDVRWTMCVPTMVLQLGSAVEGDRPLRDVRAMTIGGGPMEAAALARAEGRLGTRILRVFGMSECLGHTSPRMDDPDETRLGTDGRPFPGTELRVVDLDGVPVAAGEVGRAQVRGPSLFLGYARSGAVEAPEVTPDGFFPTGDLMSVRADGVVSVRGREKSVIIRGGRNIDIVEVETALASHPAIEQLCVVPVPDELLGERVAVLIVTQDAGFDLDAATAHLDQRGLMKAKWPEYLFRVDELPLNRVGKLSRADAARTARELSERSAV